MFNDEEEKLQRWKSTIEENELPNDRLEQAILEGFNRGKETKVNKRNKFVKRGIWSVVVAAVLFVALVTSIRVSPVFANAIALLPGMEKIVELIQDNKGLVSAIENEYYQPLNITSTQDEVSLTLDGIIADEEEMVVFYTLSGVTRDENFQLRDTGINDANGNPINTSVSVSWPVNNSSYMEDDNKKVKSEPSMMSFRITDGLIESNYILTTTVKSHDKAIDFAMPFSINKEKMPTTIYSLNKTVEIEGQKIIVEQIEISPIKTGIMIKSDSNNTKKILGFEDLRLVDENGGVWSSITDGVSSSGTDDDNFMIYYLQSNYFENPKELTLMFNKLQAIDKSEAFLLIDTEKQVLMEQPKDEKYSLVKSGERYLDLILKAEENYYKDPFINFTDAKGNVIGFAGGSFSRDSEYQIYLSPRFSNEPYVNPIKIPLYAHPSWIEGEVKIKIK